MSLINIPPFIIQMRFGLNKQKKKIENIHF